MEEKLDRRGFFSQGTKKISQGATELLAKKAQENASHWIRPPFAVDEINFLLLCTRCNQCISACPDDVIFPLSARLGVQVYKTPAMDLLNKSCQLCKDWPCVNSCETKALEIPSMIPSDPLDIKSLAKENIETDTNTDTDTDKASQNKEITTQEEKKALAFKKKLAKKKKKALKKLMKKQANQLPKIAMAFINLKTCIAYSGPECGACRVCPVPNAMLWIREKPIIDNTICTGCAICRESCITEPKAIIVQSKYKQ
jgi:ferredoxin-type protein NapG